MDLKEEEILGDRIGDHWYYAAKGRALNHYIRGIAPGSILDVGAGSGIFSRGLLARGWRDAVCVDPGYEGDRSERHHGKTVRFTKSVDRSDADLVLMMDVCEHVDDDVALIGDYVAKTGPGTHFLITVPAFQFLFSAHDLFLEHRRRYTIGAIEDSARRAGLDILRSNYLFAVIFPLAATQRIVEKILIGRGQMRPRSSLRVHGRLMNRTLKIACAIERPLFRLNRFFGLSVFCLARVPEAR